MGEGLRIFNKKSMLVRMPLVASNGKTSTQIDVSLWDYIQSPEEGRSPALYDQIQSRHPV